MTSRAGLPRLPWPVSLACVAAFLALGACPSAAERSDEVNSIHAGAASIQFLTFGGGYTSPLATNGIYLKAHFSDRGALRIGTDFSLSEASGDGTGDSFVRIRNYGSHSFTVSAEIEEYVDRRGPVTVFFGFGPYWKRSDYHDDGSRTTFNSGVSYYTIDSSNSTSWVVGGAASAGFEWFFKRKLSVLGRVGASFGFGKQHDSFRYTTTDQFGNVVFDDRSQLDSDTATASSSSAALGLGLYF